MNRVTLGRSIFGRVFIGTTVAVVLALAIVGLALPTLVESVLLAAREQQLLTRGHQAEPILAAYLEGRLDESAARSFLEGLAAQENGEVWLVDVAGRTMLDTGGDPTGLEPDGRRGIRHGGWRQRGSRLQGAADAQCVLAGSAWMSRGETDPGPDAVVSVGIPVRSDDGSGPVLGGLYFNSPVADLFNTAGRLQKYFLAAGGVGLIVSLGLAALLSRNIARPVNVMTAMAGRMAEGDFGARAPTGADEVGRLGQSLNVMAASLSASREEAERLEQLRRDLVANVSHDIRSPVTAIRGYTEALLDGTITGEPERRKYLEVIRNETESLGLLVGDLLELSRLEAGAVALRTGRLDLGRLLREIGRRYQARADEAGIGLIVDVPDDLPPVLGDEARVGRAVGNLLDNAVEFTPAGGEVRLKADARPPGRVGIVVSDTGPGIAPEDLPYIWERFYKADRARTRGREGSGLGLAIVRQVAEAHGGRADVASRPGRGASFEVEFPTAHISAEGSESCHTDDTDPG